MIEYEVLPGSVAPPRGERGLKFSLPFGDSPRPVVAPPRGERGLKWRFPAPGVDPGLSLPRAGSVD